MESRAEPAIEEARRVGFDIDLLESNLTLSPEQWWRQHRLAMEMVFELEQARIARDAKLRSDPSPSR